MSDNTTATTTTQETFNVLYNHWSDDQQQMYSLKKVCATSALYAFVTVLTQFAVSQWIWSSKTKSNHHSPVYLVSLIVFVLLWSMLMNGDAGIYDPVPAGFNIAVPLLAFGGVILNLLFCWVWSSIFKDTSRKVMDDGVNSETEDDATANLPSVADAAEAVELGQSPIPPESQSPISSAPKLKIDYINNIKIFLTCLVIVFHVAYNGFSLDPSGSVNMGIVAFTFLNESFFMSLFFFFSGYFSPRSLNKKGTYMFLFDKLKRLGIPMVIILYVLGPYITYGTDYLLSSGDTGFHPPLANVNVVWFLQQLILFNIIYAFACGVEWAPKIKCPSLLSFYGIGLALCVVAVILGFFLPIDDTVLGVPFFWKLYPSYILFFFGGALAQVNNWMDEIKNKNRFIIYGVAVISTIAFGLTFKYPIPIHCLSAGIAILPAIPVSLAITVFFYDFVNQKYAVTPFFSKAMYTAYLIQLLGLVSVSIKCWWLIMGAVGSDGQGAGLVFAGWLFSSVMALTLCWTLGYAIVSIPGFSKVL